MTDRSCNRCEFYDRGYCTLADAPTDTGFSRTLAHKFREREEIDGGCGARGKLFVLWNDPTKRDFETFVPTAHSWR